MKLTIDTEAKTIKILEKASIAEIGEFIKKLELLEDWTIETDVKVVEKTTFPASPITYPSIPYDGSKQVPYQPNTFWCSDTVHTYFDKKGSATSTNSVYTLVKGDRNV